MNIYIVNGEDYISVVFPDLEHPGYNREALYMMSFNITPRRLRQLLRKRNRA